MNSVLPARPAAANRAGRDWAGQGRVVPDQIVQAQADQGKTGRVGRGRAGWRTAELQAHQPNRGLDQGLGTAGHRRAEAAPVAGLGTAEHRPARGCSVSAGLGPGAESVPDVRRGQSTMGRTEGSPVAAGRCCSRILPTSHTSVVLGLSLGYGSTDDSRISGLHKGRTIPGNFDERAMPMRMRPV